MTSTIVTEPLPLRLLLVDDDAALLRMMTRFLTREGFHVTAAAGCVEALRRLGGDEAFDAIVTDLKLGDGSGSEVVRAARRLDPQPYTVVMTGHYSALVSANTLRDGAQDCIEKPISGPALAAQLRQACGREEVSDRDTLEVDEVAQGTGVALILDDDPGVLHVVDRVLRDAGMKTITTSSASEALRVLAESPADVVVSDISMPGMTGVEFLEHLRRTGSEVPVIFVTGLPELSTAIRAVELGAFRYLTKPFDHEELATTAARAANFGRMAALKKRASELLEPRILEQDPQTLRRSFDSACERLWMAAQPIVATDAMRTLYGYEYLLRSDDVVLRTPGHLLAAAEQLDAVPQLSQLVYALVAAAAPEEDCALFVNVHPADLRHKTLYDRRAPLTRIAERVVLEITERGNLEQVPDLRGRISALRDLGFRVAVDDLGAGYAGLNSLVSLHPDVVKLDMTLVRDIDSSVMKRALVGSMARVCQDLGILIVAEGIETEAELETIQELGCDLVQGYLIGKPQRLLGAGAMT